MIKNDPKQNDHGKPHRLGGILTQNIAYISLLTFARDMSDVNWTFTTVSSSDITRFSVGYNAIHVSFLQRTRNVIFWIRFSGAVMIPPRSRGNIRNTGLGGAERHASAGYVGISAAATRTGSLVTSSEARSAELRRVMWVYLPLQHGRRAWWRVAGRGAPRVGGLCGYICR